MLTIIREVDECLSRRGVVDKPLSGRVVVDDPSLLSHEL